MKIYTIWQAIKDYAQSYFVYTIESSLLVSNYSVRVDNVLEYAGNFPIWNTELFRRKPDLMYAVSRHAHMPCFFITELIHGILCPKHKEFNLDYRAARGDTSFFKYVFHNALSEFHNFYKNTYNLFGVCELEVDIESGTLNGEYEKAYYYISSKKTYSNRFTTDCYAQFFENLVRASEVGIDEMREYNTIQPTADEFEQQHSRFIAKMSNIGSQAA